MGLTRTLLKWIESYLTDRTQVVRFKGKTSTAVNVISGVPQGSHLGPLLFILFVDDVNLVLNRLNVLIYADDMKLYMEICSRLDLQHFQDEIDVFYNWCTKSLLDINVKKCNIISYSRKHTTHDFTCTLGNQLIVRCNKIRDLGVILDSKLTFVDHVNTTIHRAYNMLGFIKRFSFHFKDPYTIKTLYVAYVRSILEYCTVVWSPYQETYIGRIESVQKQFLLFALRKLGWTTFPLPSYESRCMLINIETLKKRREIAMISFINDIISQRINSVNLLASLNFYAPSRILRIRNLFHVTPQRTIYAKNRPINRMMNIYNKYCEIIDVTMPKAKLRKILTSRVFTT